MKKIYTVISFLILTLLLSNVDIKANAAPIMEGEYPGSLQVIPLVDHDIHIESELLVFDFNHSMENQGVLNNFYSPVVKVDATYNMRNDGESETIKMGFPFVGAINSEMMENISIKLNNDAIIHKIYYGQLNDYIYDIENLDIETIFALTSEIDLEYFSENKGYLYSFTKTNLDLSIDFEEGLPETIIHNGLYYLYNPDYIWNAFDDTLEDVNHHMFLLEEVPFECIGGTYEVQEISFEDYITQYLNLDLYFTQDQARLGFLDMLDSNRRFSHISSLQLFIEEPRLMMFEFEGEILSGQNTMEVSYYFPGSALERYEPTLYRYTYFLSPASHWKSFSDLTIQIKLGNDYPFLIEDQNEMIQLGDGTYERFYSSLPDGEFAFSISSVIDPKIPTHPLVYIGIALLLFGLGFVIIVVIVFIALLKRATKKVVKVEQPEDIRKLW